MAIVQQNSGTIASGTTITVTLPTASNAANRVVVFIGCEATVATPSGFTLRESQVNFIGQYLFEAAGGASSWAFTAAASAHAAWHVFEVSGSYDASASANATATAASYATPSLTPTAGARNLFASVAFLGEGASNTSVSAWSNSFTSLASSPNATRSNVGMGTAGESVTASGSTAYTTTATYSNTDVDGNSAIIAAYTDGSSGGGSASPNDALAFTDSVSAVRSGAAVQTPNDLIALTDAVAFSRDFSVTLNDSLLVTDTGQPQTLGFGESSSDALGAADSTTTTVGAVRDNDDPLGVTDTVSANLIVAGNSALTIPDQLGVTDAVMVELSLVVTVDDLLELIDTPVPDVESASDQHPTDAFGFTDSLLASVERVVSVSDAVAVVDVCFPTVPGFESWPDRVDVIPVDSRIRVERL